MTTQERLALLDPELLARFRAELVPDPDRFDLCNATATPEPPKRGKGRPAKAVDGECDHAQYSARKYDKYRYVCAGCGQKYNRSHFSRPLTRQTAQGYRSC